MDESSDYIGYFSLKYQRLTYEYLVSVAISFAYLMLIIYTILNNVQMDSLFRVALLLVNLLAILLFNVGMRRAYMDSIADIEKKMTQLMHVYYPGKSDDLKEFSLAVRELGKILKVKERGKKD